MNSWGALLATPIERQADFSFELYATGATVETTGASAGSLGLATWQSSVILVLPLCLARCWNETGWELDSLDGIGVFPLEKILARMYAVFLRWSCEHQAWALQTELLVSLIKFPLQSSRIFGLTSRSFEMTKMWKYLTNRSFVSTLPSTTFLIEILRVLT